VATQVLLDVARGKIEGNGTPGLGRLELEEALEARHLPFAGMVDADRDELVLRGDPLEGRFAREDFHVGKEEDDRVLVQDPIEVAEREVGVRAQAFGFVDEHVADDAQELRAPLLGRHDAFDLIGKEQRADLVVVFEGGERERRGDLGQALGLAPGPGAAAERAAHVDDEQDGAFALFLENFEDGILLAGRDVPRNVTDVVAVDVAAELAELHAGSAERGSIRAGHAVAHELAARDLDGPHLREKLRWHRHDRRSFRFPRERG